MFLSCPPDDHHCNQSLLVNFWRLTFTFDVRIVTTQTNPSRLQRQVFKSPDKMNEHCRAVVLSPTFWLESDFWWTWTRTATRAVLRQTSIVPVCGLCISHEHHTHRYRLLSVYPVTEIMLLHWLKPQYWSVDVILHAVIYVIWTWTCARRLRTWTFDFEDLNNSMEH